MNWADTLEALIQGDMVKIMGAKNYLFLFKGKQYCIFSPPEKIYRISIGDRMKRREDWIIDNSMKELLEDKLKIYR